MTASSRTDPCYVKALRLLTARDYSVQSILRKLQQRGYEPQEVQLVVERLLAEGFLDDRRYAERLLAAARESGRFVGYRLRQELLRRGFSVELLEELLRDDAAEESGHQVQTARQLVARRYPGVEPHLADERERRRIAGFLQRRGYGFATIRELFKRSGSDFE